MKRFFVLVLILGLVWGCQQQAEEKSSSKTETQAQQTNDDQEAELLKKARDNRPMSPDPRFSPNSKIWLTSGEGKPGDQVKLDIFYYIDEPSKTIVVPLTFLGNVSIDSFSWVGSSLESYGMKPTNVRNDLNIFLAAVVPTTEPDIPADSGFFGSIYFTIDKDAKPQTVNIETTFVYPGNTLSFVDTLIGSVTPQWEAGVIKVTQ